MPALQPRYDIIERAWGVFMVVLFRSNGHSGSEKGVFWKRGLFRKVDVLEILENLVILDNLENPQTA